MNRVFLAGLASMVLASPLSAQRSLTIYSDGRVLVRAGLPLRVSSGTSSHSLAVGYLNPGSIFSLDPDVTVMGASYDAAVDEQNTMRRAIGRKLVFETGGWTNGRADTVVAEVMGVDPELYRLADGTVTFQRPGRPRYPIDLILTAPTVSLNVRSTANKDQLRLAWFTDGAAWNAEYQVVLGRGNARITGQAELNSGRLSADEAEIQLLAGNVGRATAQSREEMLYKRDVRMAAAAAPSEAAQEQQVGEAHLYTIPGRYNLRPGVATVAALFDPGTADWERVYTVRGTLPWYGPVPEYVEDTPVPVEVQYILKRGAETPFGKKPLPGGTWRVYLPDSASRLQLIGEASSQHSAPGQDLRLSAGTAFDLTAQRVQTEYSTQREARRTIALLAYRVTVSNAKDSAVTVDVLEDRRGEWQVLESSIPAEKLSTSQTRFRLRVPPNGQASVTYRLRVIW